MYFPSELFAHILSFANQYFIPSNLIVHATVLISANEAAHHGIFTYTQSSREYLKMASHKRHDLAITIATNAIEGLQKSYRINNKISYHGCQKTGIYRTIDEIIEDDDDDDEDDDCIEDNDYTFPEHTPAIHDVLSCIAKKQAIYAAVVAMSCRGVFSSRYVYNIVNRHKVFVKQYYRHISRIAYRVMGPYNDDENYDIAENSSIWRCNEYQVDVVNDIYEKTGKDVIRCLYDGDRYRHISEILTIDDNDDYDLQVISPTGFTYTIYYDDDDYYDEEEDREKAKEQLYNSVVVYHLLQGRNPYDVYKSFKHCMNVSRYCTRLIYAIARSVDDDSDDSHKFVQNFLKRTDDISDWFSGRKLLYLNLAGSDDYNKIVADYSNFFKLFKNDSIFDIIQL